MVLSIQLPFLIIVCPLNAAWPAIATCIMTQTGSQPPAPKWLTHQNFLPTSRGFWISAAHKMKPLSMKNHGTQVYPQEHKYLRVTWWLGDLTSALEQTPNPWPKGRLTITWNKKEKSNLKPAIVVDSIGFSRKIGWSHSHSKNAPGMMDKIRERAQIQLLAREQRLQPFNWQNLGIALSAQPDSSIQNRKHYVDIEPKTNSKKFTGQEPVFSSTPSTTGPTTPLNPKKTS